MTWQDEPEYNGDLLDILPRHFQWRPAHLATSFSVTVGSRVTPLKMTWQDEPEYNGDVPDISNVIFSGSDISTCPLIFQWRPSQKRWEKKELGAIGK